MELRYWAASQPLPNVGLHFGYCHKKTTGFRGAAPAGELSPVERPRLTEIETKSLYHMKDETGFSTILHLSFVKPHGAEIRYHWNATGSSTMVAPNNVYTYDPFCFTVLLHQDVTNRLATRHPKNPREFTELATLIRLFCQVDMIVSFRYPTCQDGQTENNLAPTNARTLPNGH